jgi:hypothetical protein
MTSNRHATAYSIGWDVGGWNCDRNTKSRDAIIILNGKLGVVGQPWRGNLRETINEASTSRDWISRLFGLCKNSLMDSKIVATLAIDTPLGFSTEFQNLITSRTPHNTIGLHDTNQYLYRKTERLLFERNKKPLSPIKDMIGSQATKGMHVLAKFAHHAESCGEWSHDERTLVAIEAYPASCKQSPLTKKLLNEVNLPAANRDIQDAAICAVIAHMFRTNRNKLWSPSKEIPINEGWIWLPKDALAT